MIFDIDELTKEEQEEIKQLYSDFKKTMLDASEKYKKLREFRPEGDCQEDPPDDINMYTQFELLSDIFSSIRQDDLRLLTHNNIKKSFMSGNEHDSWYDVELVEARDQLQIRYEKFLFS